MRKLLILLFFSTFASTCPPSAPSDWDYSKHSTNISEIQSGGLIKDKIDKTELTLEFDAENDKLPVKDQTGNTLDQMILC